MITSNGAVLLMTKVDASNLILKDCFIIHLERAIQRKPQVQKLTETLPYKVSVIAAVDGSQPSHAMSESYKPNLLRPRYPFSLRQAEIATFLSHRKCWQRIVDEGLKAALVIEDDVEIIQTEFLAAIEIAMQKIERGDLIRLPVKLREKPQVIVSSNNHISLFKSRAIGLGMVAQIVTYDAAKRLLERTKRFDRPVDTYTQLTWDHGIRILTLWPNGIREISENLGGSLIGAPKTKLNRLRREIQRPIYRVKLSISSWIFKKAV
jgi:glycosyl transferase family 25